MISIASFIGIGKRHRGMAKNHTCIICGSKEKVGYKYCDKCKPIEYRKKQYARYLKYIRTEHGRAKISNNNHFYYEKNKKSKI